METIHTHLWRFSSAVHKQLETSSLGLPSNKSNWLHWHGCLISIWQPGSKAGTGDTFFKDLYESFLLHTSDQFVFTSFTYLKVQTIHCYLLHTHHPSVSFTSLILWTEELNSCLFVISVIWEFKLILLLTDH